jgi:alpha-methylacyl-CoA racemase
LKKPSHIDIFKTILKDVDVLIDPYRPGVLEKLGIGPKECHEINKKLIINRITGYGQEGTLKDRAGHDLNYLAYSGMLSTFGRKNEVPTFPNNLLVYNKNNNFFLAKQYFNK